MNGDGKSRYYKIVTEDVEGIVTAPLRIHNGYLYFSSEPMVYRMKLKRANCS